MAEVTGLDELIARLEKATGPDRDLDAAIYWVVNPKSARTSYWNASPGLPCPLADMPMTGLGYLSVKSNAPRYTKDITSAVSLIPEALEWIIGKGKVRPDEPPFGIQIFPAGSGRNVHMPVPLAEAEGDHLALVICRAALTAANAS